MVSSNPLREELESKGILRTVLWPRGVDTELFRIRSKSFLTDPRPIFLYVGRVAVEKNIGAFLSLNLPGTKYVVGDGPARSHMEQCHPEVRFVGTQRGLELARYFAASDVFVFPSLTDTFGIVMLEAMACGLPVAAFPIRGPLEIVQKGLTGYLDDNLEKAAFKALKLSPVHCREQALQYSWENSAKHFEQSLVRTKPESLLQEICR
jgi:glycosyltransferase involved in cell wall biosynthesis